MVVTNNGRKLRTQDEEPELDAVYSTAFEYARTFGESVRRGKPNNYQLERALSLLKAIQEAPERVGRAWKTEKPQGYSYIRPHPDIPGDASHFGLKIYPSGEEADRAFETFQTLEATALAAGKNYAVKVPETIIPIDYFMFVQDIPGIDGNAVFSKIQKDARKDTLEMQRAKTVLLEEMLLATAFIHSYLGFKSRKERVEAATNLKAGIEELVIKRIFEAHAVYQPELAREVALLLQGLMVDEGNVVKGADPSPANFIIKSARPESSIDRIIDQLSSRDNLRSSMYKVDPATATDPAINYFNYFRFDHMDAAQLLTNGRLMLSDSEISELMRFYVAAKLIFDECASSKKDKFISGVDLGDRLRDKNTDDSITEYEKRYPNNDVLSLVVTPLIKVSVVRDAYIPNTINSQMSERAKREKGAQHVEEMLQKLGIAQSNIMAYEARTNTVFPNMKNAISEIMTILSAVKTPYIEGNPGLGS